MKKCLMLITALLLLAGCAPWQYPPETPYVRYEPTPFENPWGITDPALVHWYTLPYFNPYQQ
jgi:hypothetical protein